MRELTIQTESAGRLATGFAEVDYNQHKVALKRALLCLACCWGIGLLTSALPLMQVVIPPTAFLGGVLVAVFVYAKTKVLPQSLRGSSKCTHCGQETRFQFENVRPPFYSSCEACRTGYRIIWPPEKTPNDAEKKGRRRR